MLLLDPPVTFGPYRLTSRVATGGMAEVYVGRRTDGAGTGPMVAVKRLLPHYAKDPAVVQMFLNEAKITAQISHRNVVKVIDFGRVLDEPYIAMELLDGHTLAELRDRAAESGERLPMGFTLKVLTEACRGLDAAHRAVGEDGRPLQIVHRDFTPENIHIGTGGEIKVLDFGIAKAAHVSSHTEPGTIKGKYYYMSPEMIAGRPVDHRADQFAAGVMLYEQLCGRRPFTGLDRDQILDNIAKGDPKPPKAFDPSVPITLEQICLKALSADPSQRFSSLQEFIQSIELLGESVGLPKEKEIAEYLLHRLALAKDVRRKDLAKAREADPSSPAAKHLQSLVPLKRSNSRSLTAMALGAAVLAALFFGIKFLKKRGHSVTNASTESQLSAAGQSLIQTGAFREALELSEQGLQRFPKSYPLTLLEAGASTHLRLGKRAEAALTRAGQLEPSRIETEKLWINLYQLEGDYPHLLEHLAIAEKKAKGTFLYALRLQRGLLLSQLGRLEEAAPLLNDVLRQKFDPEGASELAFVYYREGSPNQALPLLRRAIKERPGLAKAHYYLGAVLFTKGDLVGAENEYRQADASSPDDPRFLQALCELQVHTHQTEAAAATRALFKRRFPTQSAPACK